jgi:hypothetical protein
MNSSASNFGLGSEFDAFLFAPIGEDRNGLTLRIVSLLARLDLDPWQEASTLAELAPDAAAQKLASLLAAQSVPSLKPAHLGTVATRLVSLLPRQTPLARPSLELLRTDSFAHPRLAMRAILLAIWLIGLLSVQAILDRFDAPLHTDTAQVSAPVISTLHTLPAMPVK